MQGKVIIKKTEDGSTTLFVPELDEHYHSIHGAVNESMHVFIDKGLKTIDKEQIAIFEVGFGTGLNAFLTLLNGVDKTIEYVGVEKYPLDSTVTRTCDLGCYVNEKQHFNQLHDAEWDNVIQINERFRLEKVHADLRNITINDNSYDLIYFDAFAPDKHADLWSEQIFSKLYNSLKPGGIIVTYCAKGVVRRMMQDIGFEVERLPGPPPKKEMLRAQKPLL